MQNRQGDVKNSIRNGVAKELTCMTHGHELRGRGLPEGMEGTRWTGAKGENWNNCNSTIKYIFSKRQYQNGITNDKRVSSSRRDNNPRYVCI